MLNFQQKNQSFRTLDLLGLVVLVGAVGSIAGAIIAQAFQDDRVQRTRDMVGVLARQIRSEQSKIQPRPSQRNPASVQPSALTAGRLGLDPWGKQFHYSVKKISQGDNKTLVRVYVWSNGPNGKEDTSSASVGEGPGLGKFKPTGDDIGYVEEFATET